MTGGSWRPRDEADAAGAMAVFIEWLRATGRMPDADPARVRSWQAVEPARFRAALAEFAGLDSARNARDNLLRHDGARAALVACDASGVQRTWSRDEVRQRRDLPPAVAAALDALTWDDLLDLASDHLLRAGTRADERLVWTGDPAAKWPYGAWIAGAVVVLG